MKKKYKANTESILQQIINKQQEEIEKLKNDSNIKRITKERDQAILACKFLSEILLMLDVLDRTLANNTIIAEVIQPLISTFRFELSNAMLSIHYDGNDGFEYDSLINNNEDNYEDEYD